MSEGNRLNLKVGVPGTTKTNKPKTRVQKHLTLELISSWIRLQGFDEYTTNGLIEMASGYPTQALPSFRKNFNLMIERVREKRTKEQQGEVQEVKVPKKNKYEDLPEKVSLEACQVVPKTTPEKKEQENGEEVSAN